MNLLFLVGELVGGITTPYSHLACLGTPVSWRREEEKRPSHPTASEDHASEEPGCIVGRSALRAGLHVPFCFSTSETGQRERPAPVGLLLTVSCRCLSCAFGPFSESDPRAIYSEVLPAFYNSDGMWNGWQSLWVCVHTLLNAFFTVLIRSHCPGSYQV